MASKATIKQECCVCEDEFTSSRIVTCLKCESSVCKTCMKQFIETNGTDACCLNDACGAVWSRRFLTENFGSSYVNGKYKKMIDLNRVDRVHATNSRFMEDAKRYKNMLDSEKEKDKYHDELQNIYKQKQKIFKEYQSLCNKGESQTLENLRNQYAEIDEKCKKAIHKYELVQSAYYRAIQDFENPGVGGGGEKDEEKVVYQKGCPQDDCKGFLSQKGVCGLCNVHVCGKCNVVKGIEKDEISQHKCKKEDIESVEAIRKETKPCPRCATRIHKIDGCDQMWCPYCQDKYGEGTTFSWTTGRIERGRIHNPHYIDYMRNRMSTLREVGDVHCGGLPQIWQFDMALQDYPDFGRYRGNIPRATRIRVMNMMRRVYEINQYVVEPLRETLREQNVHKMDQIKHILGIYNDDEFRRSISRTEKKKEKEQEILDIFEVVVAVLTEQINKIYNDPSDINIVTFLSFVEEFVKEENRYLADISYIYKQAVNKITIDINTNYHPPKQKFRITSKKDLEYYKKTGVIFKKESRASKKIANSGIKKTEPIIDLTN